MQQYLLSLTNSRAAEIVGFATWFRTDAALPCTYCIHLLYDFGRCGSLWIL